MRRNRRPRAERGLVAQPEGEAAPPSLFPRLLTSWWPTLVHFVHLENSEAWPLSLLLLESRSSCNVRNTKSVVFCETELEPEEGDCLENPLKRHKPWELHYIRCKYVVI
jgi:hypothetical protein